MNLKEWIKVKGLSQTQVAKAINVDLTRLNRHINGVSKLSLKQISKLAEFLGISREEAEQNEVLKAVYFKEIV